MSPRISGRSAREDLAPGGRTHDAHTAFLEWAAAYDTGGAEMRSRRRHEAWISDLPCPVVRLEGERAVEDRLDMLERALP